MPINGTQTDTTVVYWGKNNNADVEKSIISHFSFSFITRNVRNGRVRERVEDVWDIHRGWDTNLQWTTSYSFFFRETGTGPTKVIESLASPCFSTFSRRVQGHLKPPNRLNFCSLLDFCKSRQGHRKALNHLRFFLSPYFCESR